MTLPGIKQAVPLLMYFWYVMLSILRRVSMQVNTSECFDTKNGRNLRTIAGKYVEWTNMHDCVFPTPSLAAVPLWPSIVWRGTSTASRSRDWEDSCWFDWTSCKSEKHKILVKTLFERTPIYLQFCISRYHRKRGKTEPSPKHSREDREYSFRGLIFNLQDEFWEQQRKQTKIPRRQNLFQILQSR